MIDNPVSATVKEMEEAGHICPPENKKNTYTMVCWLLGLYQKLGYAGEARALRPLLPVYREACERGEP